MCDYPSCSLLGRYRIPWKSSGLLVLLSDEVEERSMWFNSVAVQDLNNFMTFKPILIITCRVRVGRSEEVLIQTLPLGGHHVSGRIYNV